MSIYPTITINGVSSNTIAGLLVTSLPPISKPLQRTLVDVIDGRAGDVVTPLGFASYDKPVGIALTTGYDIDEVISFFNSAGVVTFSNEPDKYYKFAIYDQIDFERLIRFKTATVIFHVQPYKYSNNENPLNFAIASGEPVSVTNSGNTDSKPDLMITGEGVVDLDINGEEILNIDFGESEQTYIIDSDSMNAYATENAIKDIKTDFIASQASGTPTPSSPIPIVGVDKVNITRTGKNLCGGSKLLANAQAYLPSGTTDIVNKTFTFTAWATMTQGLSFTTGLKFKENTQYTFIFVISKESGTGTNLRTFYTDGTADNIGVVSETDTKTTIVYKTNANKTIESIGKYNSSSRTTLYYDECGIFEGDLSETDFKPYNGTTALINLGGTYYGGSVDVVTGKITITWNYINLGDLEWFYNSTNGYFYNLTNITPKSGTKNWLCTSRYLKPDTVAWSAMEDGMAGFGGVQFRVKDSSTTSSAQFKQNINGTYLAYELETPIEVQASNTAELQAVLDVNNIFSDTGDVEVTYKAGGVIHTETGEIVTFTLTPEDYERGAFVNRQIVGNYDNIKLKRGANTISLSGNAKSLTVDKYSRWI